VHIVPNDFKSHSIQTDTQKDRIEHDAKALEAQAIAEEQKAKKEFAEKEKKAKDAIKKEKGHLERNTDNPVIVGNAVAVVAIGAGLGFGAYRKYIAGELTWKVVGAWAGLVGLFAAGDYYLSQLVDSVNWFFCIVGAEFANVCALNRYLFKNKYPTRK
jgi:cation transport ATPase